MMQSQILYLHFFQFVLLVAYLGTVVSVDIYTRQDFPPDFVFGAGTSAYQVEGAALEDGRTPCIWDTFTHAGLRNGANGDIACDGYHKYKEDIQLMVDTGLEAFRFSISWSRLIPNGRGAVNPKGLKFYNNFINELMNHGIEPHVTIFHHDLPQFLEDEYDGWLSKKAVKDYVAFADVCFREFGDRVLHWTTFNEANAFAIYSYDVGELAPGRCSSPFGTNCIKGNSSSEPYIVVHNMLLAHALASRLYQKKYKDSQHGIIGLNVMAFWYAPYTNATIDVQAAQRAIDFWVGWIVNPVVFGDYPDTMKKNAGTRIPSFTDYESEKIKGSFDFIAINHYTTVYIKDKSSNLEINKRDLLADIGVEMINTIGDVSPNQYVGLQKILEYFKEKYGNPPIYIHENGLPTPRNGTLNDTSRVDYLHGFIGSLLDAVRNGTNTKGYFMWSFLDLFEIFDGYKSGYGLYYVDLDDKDLRRFPKLSHQWYSNFLKGRNMSIDAIIQLDKTMYASSI